MDKYIEKFFIFIFILYSVLFTFALIKAGYDIYKLTLKDNELIIYSIKGSDRLLIVPTNNREEKSYILVIEDTIKSKRDDFIITKHK